MNYQRIYNEFISSRLRRVLDEHTVYQRHHIIPRHEDPKSKDVVYLTVKEHAFVHRIRYKMTSTMGNYLAWKSLMGVNGKEVILRERSRIGGLSGGAITKNSNKGIFSPEWDRSKETSSRWQDGRLSHDHFKHLKESGHHHKAGCASRDQKKGFHSDLFDKSENCRKIWAKLTTEEYEIRCENNRLAQLNLSAESHKRRAEGARRGGLASAKIPCWTNGVTNKRSKTKPGEGWALGQTRRHKTTKILTTYFYKEKHEQTNE